MKQKRYIFKSMKFIFPYLKPYRWKLFISFLCSLFYVFTFIYIPIVAGDALDAMGSGVDFNIVYLDMVKIAVSMVVGGGFYWGLSYLSSYSAYSIARDIRKDCINKILWSEMSYLDSSDQGDIITTMTADVDFVSDGLIQVFLQIFTGFFSIIGTIVFMCILCWPLALIVIGLTPLSMIASIFLARGSAKTFKNQSNVRGELGGYYSEQINSQQIVISENHQVSSEKDADEIAIVLKKYDFWTQFFAAFINPTTRMINAIIYGSVAVVGAIYIVNGEYSLTTGDLMTFLMFTTNYTKPFNEISNVVAQLQNSFASISRLIDLFEMPEIIDEEYKPSLKIESGELDLDNVRFSYNQRREIIKGISLHIKNGDTVALVGTTGCGKTTLINLIMRFYEPSKGVISISGQDITKVNRKSVRDTFGMVLQDTWVFKGTIRENIKYGKLEASDEEIITAAKKANAHFFITQMKDGYDTIIDDENGLSTGQKQLLCIARLMLKEPEMLILDEATSNIDTRTQILIQDGFKQIMKNHTSIIIAHRLSTIENADVILVMNEGIIMEQGTHQELLEKGGFYSSLYHSQFAQI